MLGPVFFLRGINTYPGDSLRFGPLNFGLAHRFLENKMTERGFDFIAIEGMGQGSLSTQVEGAIRQIEAYQPKGLIHLLGHSVGGVAARALAHKLHKTSTKIQVRTLITMASPHRGARLAEVAPTIARQRPVINRILKGFGYDLASRLELFEPMRSDSMSTFNTIYPDLPEIKYASIVSGSEVSHLPLALQFIYEKIGGLKTPSDGIVEMSSQPWGQVLTEAHLDHGALLGFKTAVKPAKLRKNAIEFERVVNCIASFITDAERS